MFFLAILGMFMNRPMNHIYLAIPYGMIILFQSLILALPNSLPKTSLHFLLLPLGIIHPIQNHIDILLASR